LKYSHENRGEAVFLLPAENELDDFFRMFLSSTLSLKRTLQRRERRHEEPYLSDCV